MAVNSSFVPTLTRMSALRNVGAMQGVSWDNDTGVYMLDGVNAPFRPSKLVKFFTDGECGYNVTIGDDGGFLERQIKIGGSPQHNAQVVLNLDLPEVDDTADGRNFLSTLLKEFHCASLFTPHCRCCLKKRCEDGHRFCDDCNNPYHLMNHYFPHHANVGSCCYKSRDHYDECCLFCLGHQSPGNRLLSRGARSATATVKFSFAHLPDVPVEVWIKVMQFLFVPCYQCLFVEEWNNVSRDGSRLMLTVNHNTKYIYESVSPVEFEFNKNRYPVAFKNPDRFVPKLTDRVTLDVNDENYVSNDPYMGDGSCDLECPNFIFVNEDPMFPNGVRSSDAQTLPVVIDVQLGRLNNYTPDDMSSGDEDADMSALALDSDYDD